MKKLVTFVSPGGYYIVMQYPDGYVGEGNDFTHDGGPWHEEYYASTATGGFAPGRDKVWVKQGESPGVFQGWPEGFDT